MVPVSVYRLGRFLDLRRTSSAGGSPKKMDTSMPVHPGRSRAVPIEMDPNCASVARTSTKRDEMPAMWGQLRAGKRQSIHSAIYGGWE